VERLVQHVKADRRANLQYRNLDRLGSQGAQSIAELPGLVGGARHEHAAAG
jgi:hypothetical protein